MSLFEHTAAELAGLVAGGEVSAVEVAQAHLDRITAVDGAVHAFLHVDTDGALAAAKAVDDARAAGERLAGLQLARVVSSPLERCRETAREIVRHQTTAPKVSTERGLLECDYGSWTGRELKTLAKEALWKTVQAHPAAAVFPDGESMADMSARAIAAVRGTPAVATRKRLALKLP